MLMGTYNYAIDDKGRLNFPAKFREEMDEEFVVACWLDKCLVAYRKEEWQAMAARVKAASSIQTRNVMRFLCSSGTLVQPDKQGRILLPVSHRKHAELTKEVSIIGVDDHAEIWDTGAWQKNAETLDSAAMEAAMIEMGL